MTTTIWIILGAIGLIVLWFIFTYNSLVALKNRVAEAWSDIDVQLKRRYDLIPNLVETVKGITKQEQTVFVEVTKARTAAMSAKGPEAKGKAENMLSDTLKSLFAVAEAYPDIKSSQNFLQLQGELTDTEDKIQASRRFYNTNVLNLNTKIETFPTNLIAGMVGAVKREFFEAAEGEKAPVKVAF